MDIKAFLGSNIAGPALLLLSPLIDSTLDAAADEAGDACIARVQATDNTLDDTALSKASRFFRRLADRIDAGMGGAPAP